MSYKARSITVRQLVFNKTKGFCCYCGKKITLETHLGCSYMVIDHLIPRSKGGWHGIENLLPCCGGCNTSKGNKTLEEWRRFKACPPPLTAAQRLLLASVGVLEEVDAEYSRRAKALLFWMELNPSSRVQL